jgi:tRNA threonylcarbamoyladenosine biosynthesis protein TsaB
VSARPATGAGAPAADDPLILALETATTFASVALLRRGALLAELTSTGSRPHSERLLPGVDRVLAAAGVTLAEVGAFAVSIGPGSFTGLRVGVATVKGLAFGDERPVVPVPTLAALAASAAASAEPVLSCLDARRGEVYAAAWGPGAAAREPLLAEGVFTPEALARAAPRPCTLVGCPGEEAVLESVRAALGPEARLAEPAPPRAYFVGRLALLLLARGAAVAASRLAPRYLRRAEAEARRTGEAIEEAGWDGAVP